jgi:hypothetical protein
VLVAALHALVVGVGLVFGGFEEGVGAEAFGEEVDVAVEGEESGDGGRGVGEAAAVFFVAGEGFFPVGEGAFPVFVGFEGWRGSRCPGS